MQGCRRRWMCCQVSGEVVEEVRLEQDGSRWAVARMAAACAAMGLPSRRPCVGSAAAGGLVDPVAGAVALQRVVAVAFVARQEVQDSLCTTVTIHISDFSFGRHC